MEILEGLKVEAVDFLVDHGRSRGSPISDSVVVFIHLAVALSVCCYGQLEILS